MPNADTVLVINPNFDVATSFIHLWANEIVDEATQLGLRVINLDSEEAQLPQFEDAITNYDPILVMGNGHGMEFIFTGDEQCNMLWVPNDYRGQTDSNIELVQGKVVYLLSCLTGKALGPAIAAQDNTYYIGYTEDFVFNGFDPGDIYSQAFGECSNAIMRTLLNGGTVQDAYNEGIMMFNHWIQVWEQSNDATASFIVSSLIHNRDALIALPGMDIPAITEKKIIVPQIVFSCYGALLSSLL